MANPCAFFPKLQFFDPRNLYEGWDSFFSGYHDSIERQSQSYQKSLNFRHR